MEEIETTTTTEPTTAERIARLLEIGRQSSALNAERAMLLEQIDTDDPDVAALAAALGLRRKSGRKPAAAKKRGSKPQESSGAAKKRGSKPQESSGVPPCYTDGSKYTGD